ncbi:DUF3073 domain-containing protein [Bifidobacterium stellenboschense]|uniref:DUF3073 domain-containing protein n=1 Tax=Bifidobacterium stellenboschense TaxID=762211 RepID=A0A087DJF6_9BIFI|nr:DUF3073 domain-containing protein [Bifidobacterium stellenboschense]KFI95656.1 hypothetical protein BSTEL_0462 [Bifidobacterium stellenboschense]
MGRGRQKAKQQKIARKLKYLTTDTDYDELAKELSGQEPGTGSVDPFADLDDHYDDHYADVASSDSARDADDAAGKSAAPAEDDLDEYAKWAAEAAAKATSGEFPKTSAKPAAPKPMPPHKPIRMPMPSALKPKKA